jgi:hypothetical protein
MREHDTLARRGVGLASWAPNKVTSLDPGLKLGSLLLSEYVGTAPLSLGPVLLAESLSGHRLGRRLGKSLGAILRRVACHRLANSPYFFVVSAFRLLGVLTVAARAQVCVFNVPRLVIRHRVRPHHEAKLYVIRSS